MNNTALEILIVDDDPIVLTVLSYYLTKAGYTVATADNGAIAWELLKSDPNRFALVILDRVMPGLSGIDLLHKIYVLPQFQAPIIMLTSHAERDDVGAAVIAGVFDFLYKPVDEVLLLLVIKRALRSNKTLF